MILSLTLWGCGQAPERQDKSAGKTITNMTAKVTTDSKPVDTTEKKSVNISIHTAVKDGSLEKIKEYLADGTDINLKDHEGFTPLHWAAYRKKPEIVKFLLEKGADPKLIDNKGFTPLHRAAFMGYADVGKMLVEAGCDIDAINANGLTARFISEKMNRAEMAEMLKAAGAKDIPPKTTP